MKQEIHPTYHAAARVTCSCGNSFTVGSTKAELFTEVCSACHPFYTGQQKLVDAAGRVERFAKILEKTKVKKAAAPKTPKAIGRPQKKTPTVQKLG